MIRAKHIPVKIIPVLTILAALSLATTAFAQAPKQAAPPPAGRQEPSGPPQKPTPQQTQADVQAIHACINLKSPEGEPPKEGSPEHEKMMKETEGGPQACAGSVAAACQTAGGEEETCVLREATAWLASTTLDKATETKFGAKNAGVYKAASAKIMANAVALCKAAAAVSAWGADAIKTNSKELVFDLSHPCVYEAIVQQSLIILVNKRGS